MIWYIFNCNWVVTRWQLFSTHVHTNNTGNVTKQTLHRTTHKYIEQHKKYIEQHKKIHRSTQQLGRVRAVPRLCGFYPGICLTIEKKARKNLSQRVNVSWCFKVYVSAWVGTNSNYSNMHGATIKIFIFIFYLFFAVALRPNTSLGLLILDVSRSRTTTHHSR